MRIQGNTPSYNIQLYECNLFQVKHLSIPIVEYGAQEDYPDSLKFTDDDVSEVIDTLKDRLRWISILFRKEIQPSLDDCYVVKIGHSGKCKIKVDAKKIKLFEGRRSEFIYCLMIQNELLGFMGIRNKEKSYSLEVF